MQSVRSLVVFLSLLFLFLSNGCATKAQRRFAYLSKEVEMNNFDAIIAKIHQEGPKLYGAKAELLYYSDLGILHHYAQNFDSSNYYLLQAIDVFESLYTKSITNEAVSVVTNDNIRPYRSSPYEMLFIHMILSLNYMALGLPDEALVESKQAQLLTDEWARKDKSDRKYNDDGLFQYLSAMYYNDIGEAGNASVSLLKSLAAYERIGLPPARQVKAMAYTLLSKVGHNDEISQFHLTHDATAYDGAQSRQSEIVILGYSGRGPVLEEQVWWGTYLYGGMIIMHYHDAQGNELTLPLPAPYVPGADDQTFSLKLALPMAKTFPSQNMGFTVSLDNSPPKDLEMVNNYDMLVERLIKDKKPLDLTRSIVRVTTRTIAAQQAKKAMQTGNSIADFFMSLGTDIAAAQLEHADTRSLFLVPKRIFMLRIPVTSGVHSLRITSKSNSPAFQQVQEINNISVAPGQKKFIFIPAFN